MQRLTLFSLIWMVFVSVTIAQTPTVGTLQNTANSFDGYTLFAPISSDTTYLIDNCGQVVHNWKASSRPAMSAYLLEDGTLLRGKNMNNQTFTAGGSGGGVELYDWNGTLIWDYTISSASECHHHDLEMLPNGNVLFVVWEGKTNAEAIDAGRNPSLLGNGIWPDKIVEVQPSGAIGGTVVWEWKAWDHMVQEFDNTKANFGVVSDHPELIDVNFPANSNSDWHHVNSVDYNEELDQIIISIHNLHEVWVIDHSTTTAEAASHAGGNSGKGGDLLYRWGNPQAYGRGTASDQQLYGQHDARWITEGDDIGKLMVFNNGQNRFSGGSYSSIDVIEPPVDAFGNYSVPTAGESFAPSDLFWTYEANPNTDFYSANISGAHRLQNDNTLICEGRPGRLFEVNAAGEVVWEYKSPVTANGIVDQGETILNNNAVFRCTRYAPDYEAFVGKNLTPGNVIELNSTVSCELFSSTTDLADTPMEQEVQVIVNQNARYITVTDISESAIISIYDSFGRLVNEKKTSSSWETLNTSYWPSGIYYLSVLHGQTKFTKKVLIL